MLDKNKISKVVRTLTAPVVAEWPFFCLFLIAIAIRSLRHFPMWLIHGDMMLAWDFLVEIFPRAGTITYCFTLLVYYTRSRAVRVACYTFATVLLAVGVFLQCVFGISLKPNTILLIAETNMQETAEFFSSYLFSPGGIVTLVLVPMYIAAIFFLEKHKASISQWWSRLKLRWRQTLSIALCAFLGLGLVQCRIYGEALIATRVEKNDKGGAVMDSVTDLFLALYSIIEVNHYMEHAVEVTLAATVPQHVFDGDSLNVIYVIGESYIKSHSHLYGYALPTTPNLDEERRRGNLFVFEDVVAPYNGTSIVMKNTLCCNSLSNEERWYDYPYFPALFKKAGYDVLLWDNQLEGASSQSFYAFTLESFMYNEQLCKASYTQVSEHRYPYDGQLVDDFTQKAQRSGSRQLVLFHLMGQHFAVSSRYPHGEAFDRFTVEDIKLDKPYLNDDKRQMIADYDNATLYNDHVLKQIIDLYRDGNTVLLYFSDHGEEVYDYRDSFGRKAFDAKTQPEGIHCQYDVPFMIWCSDKYMERNPEVTERIRQSLHKPFRTDDICQVVFHLAGLKTEYYRSEYDLLSPQYKEYRRTVEDGIVYDN